MKGNTRHWLIGLGAAVLAVATGLQWRESARPLPGKGVHLARVLPSELRGWTAEPLALGATEAISGQVEKVLKFDDVFYRGYLRADGVDLALYVAYWNPGKMPVQLVASHNPDRCWQASGWRCEEMDHHLVLPTGAGELRPGQGREFLDGQGEIEHVVFWQLVGHRLFDFGESSDRMLNPFKWWREVTVAAMSRPQEQYFVRLSSNRPLTGLKEDPGFKELLRALAKLGLAAKAAGGSREQTEN